MKILVLLSTFVLAATLAVAVAGGSGLRFFYCIDAEHPCTETGATLPVVGGNAIAVVKRALSAKDDVRKNPLLAVP